MCNNAKNRRMRKRLNKVVRKSKVKATDKVGITVTNVDILKIDYKDMLLMTVAMIPFFIALDCIFSIRTFNIRILTDMRYGFTLAPIVSAFILIPTIYLTTFYLKHREAVHKRNFFKVLLSTLAVIVTLLALRSYFSKFIIFSLPGFLFISVISIFVITYYIMKITKIVKFRYVK